MNINIKHQFITHDDVDYSFYLGPGCQNDKEDGIPPKIISPHVSCFDIQTILTVFQGNCGFVAGSFMQKVPIFGSLAAKLGSLFVPRAGQKSALDKSLEAILNRTALIEKKGEFPPLVIFPEGTCTNNTMLAKFRRGAFYDLRKVQPITLKYHHGMVHPAIESVDEPFVVFLLCCTLTPMCVEVKQLPIFAPNEYLFTKHADKGQEKWEIFAWACRDIMSKIGGFGRSEIAYRDKIKVYDYYMGNIDSLTFENGVTVEYRKDGCYINDSDENKKEQ